MSDRATSTVQEEGEIGLYVMQKRLGPLGLSGMCQRRPRLTTSKAWEPTQAANFRA
jgi:hypothetical protein